MCTHVDSLIPSWCCADACSSSSGERECLHEELPVWPAQGNTGLQ